MKKIPVGVLGATGAVGQRFIQLLDNHPWFSVTHVYASERSAGRSYGAATAWRMETAIPGGITKLIIEECTPREGCPRIMFSALDSSVASEVETAFADAGCAVISNSKNHRMAMDVPLLIPEVNPEHLELIKRQASYTSGGGYIVTNPNCTTVGLAMVLAPLEKEFGIKAVNVVSMQAASGAGYPGVPSLDLIDNVVPFIDGEEDKIITEPLKILANLSESKLVQPKILIDATCNRVAVRDGHLEAVSIKFYDKNPSIEQITEVLSGYRGLPQELDLPSAPKAPIILSTDDYRPQPTLDRMSGNGMAVTVGRVREANVYDVQLTLLVHNTIRGAAGAAILNAELLHKKSLLPL